MHEHAFGGSCHTMAYAGPHLRPVRMPQSIFRMLLTSDQYMPTGITSYAPITPGAISQALGPCILHQSALVASIIWQDHPLQSGLDPRLAGAHKHVNSESVWAHIGEH